METVPILILFPWPSNFRRLIVVASLAALHLISTVKAILKIENMKTPTTHSIKRAYSAAVKKVQADKLILESCCSAGFIIPDGQPKKRRKGFQVFIKVCRFDEEWLALSPQSGGLLCNL